MIDKKEYEGGWYKGVRVGAYIGEGNSRIVFEHRRDKGRVIKIPKSDMDIARNMEEYEGYYNDIISSGNSSIAKCFYDNITNILYMEKVDVIIDHGDNINGYGINKDGKRVIFDLNV